MEKMLNGKDLRKLQKMLKIISLDIQSKYGNRFLITFYDGDINLMLDGDFISYFDSYHSDAFEICSEIGNHDGNQVYPVLVYFHDSVINLLKSYEEGLEND